MLNRFLGFNGWLRVLHMCKVLDDTKYSGMIFTIWPRLNVLALSFAPSMRMLATALPRAVWRTQNIGQSGAGQ